MVQDSKEEKYVQEDRTSFRGDMEKKRQLIDMVFLSCLRFPSCYELH